MACSELGRGPMAAEDEMRRLRASGMRYEDIATRAGTCAATVRSLIGDGLRASVTQMHGDEIREMRARGVPVAEIAETFGTSVPNVYHITRTRTNRPWGTMELARLAEVGAAAFSRESGRSYDSCYHALRGMGGTCA